MLADFAPLAIAQQIKPPDLTHVVVSEVIDDHGHKHVLSHFGLL